MRVRNKENDKEYRRRPEVREKARIRANKIYHSDVGKKYRKEYLKRTDVVERISAFRKTDKYRQYMKKAKAKRRALLDFAHETITQSEWKDCLDYFDNCCAVCGYDLLKGNRIAAMDHWVPVSKGGLTTRNNIIPLCHGMGGCNNEKSNTDGEIFTFKKIGEKDAILVLGKIESYLFT